MSLVKYTNSTAGTSYNEYQEQFVDTQLYMQDRNIEGIRNRLSAMTFMTSIRELGLTQDTETIESIVQNMPPNSMLIYHKYGDKINAYPERTGLLTVTKGLDQSRIQFTFTGFEFFYRGFYDSLRGAGMEFWSGWRKMVESGNDVKLSANTVNTKYLGTDDGRPIVVNVSIDGNGKNLGYSESKFEQVVAKKAYFDQLEVNGKVIG